MLEDDATEKQFGRAKGLPTTFIYGPDGKRAWERTGTVTRQSLEQAISGAAKPKG